MSLAWHGERVELFLRQSLLFTIDLSDSVGVSLGIDLLERSRPGAGVSPAYVARIGAPLWHAWALTLAPTRTWAASMRRCGELGSSRPRLGSELRDLTTGGRQPRVRTLRKLVGM